MFKIFKIRIVPSWFSDEYASFEYTTDGIFWHIIEACGNDGDSIYDMYRMKPLAYKINFDWDLESQFENVLKQWSTLEKIKEYHAKEEKKVEEKNALLLEEQEKLEEKKKKFWNKLKQT